MINDYVVQWSTANHDNVANQLMRYEINSGAIQKQASQLTSAADNIDRRQFFSWIGGTVFTHYCSSGSTVTMEGSSR